jgi:hypothetical protein
MEEHHNGIKNHNEKTSASGYFKNSKNLQFSLQNWQRTHHFQGSSFTIIVFLWVGGYIPNRFSDFLRTAGYETKDWPR